jgi:hypothetical protein
MAGFAVAVLTGIETVAMSAIGPIPTSGHVRFSVARGGEADIGWRMRAVAIL